MNTYLLAGPGFKTKQFVTGLFSVQALDPFFRQGGLTLFSIICDRRWHSKSGRSGASL